MTTQPSQRKYALPIMLSILGLAIVVFLVALSGYLSNQAENIDESAQLIATSATSPLISNTPFPTLQPANQRPSWTPPPSPTITVTRTITPTVTRTIIPSLTPANPQALDARYRLVAWNLTEADRMIQLLMAQADTRADPEWYRAAALAEQEALLRYPQALNATTWRWQFANNLIQAGSSQAAQAYANIIQSGLASGQVRPNDLPLWFHSNEPELSLTSTSLAAQPGELSRWLIQISGAGSAYIWVVITPSNVQAYPLLNDFDPINNPQSTYLIADLTGDGFDELVIYQTSSPGHTQLHDPWIFSLRQAHPSQLPIQESLPLELGSESTRALSTIPAVHAGNDIEISARLFPACPVAFTRSYHWDGEKFTMSPFSVQVQPEADLLSWCEMVVDHASLMWAPEFTLSVAEPLLASWPPEEDIQGNSFPADALDGWRFRLGILQALAGHPIEANQYLQMIIDAPSTPQSTWIEPANQFLNIFQSPGDLYRACQAAPGCNLRQALQTVTRTSGLSDPSLALSYLLQHGVTARASGYFDFDGDGENDRWFSVLPQEGGKLEYWILTRTQTGVQAIFVQIFEDNSPQPYYHDLSETPLVVQLERGIGFILERDPITREAAIHFVNVEYSRPIIIQDNLERAIEALFIGVDPNRVRESLLEIRASPRFVGDCNAFGICARFYYSLGLTYELSGDTLNAAGYYLTVWRMYPLSPYTLMARMKLELIPATATMTPTITLTPTITHTPDPNRTPTPTSWAYPPYYTSTPWTYPYP